MVAAHDTGKAAPHDVGVAVNAWSRSVFTAPRRFTDLVVGVTQRDEVLHRVLTEIVRRDLREQRCAAVERELSKPRVPFAQVDPFSGTLDTLKADTAQVVSCNGCSGSGAVRCSTCAGHQSVTCSGCGGAGQFRNPRTNRLNKCKVCKATGKVTCGVCRGTGRLQCQTCSGSGRQWLWLIYVEVRNSRIAVVPESPVLLAHPQLLEPRDLSPAELGAFSVESKIRVEGALPLDDLALSSLGIVQRELEQLDQRLDRVVRQEYMRLAVPRYDVSYQMAGTTGTVTLSGQELTAASTPEALRPIRRRRMLWSVMFVALAIVGATMVASAMGTSAYFESSNTMATILWFGAVGCSVPWIGGLSRAWRPGFRVRGVRSLEVAASILWALQLFAAVGLGAWTRPNATQVEDALAAGDLARARLVVDALVEREGETTATNEIVDAVLLAEAEQCMGEERLARLDAVVEHQGSQAQLAASLARADRLARIREHIELSLPDSAIAAIDADFAASWRSDPELAEERARAEMLRGERCQDEVCRFLALRTALETHPTPQRTAAVEQYRGELLGRLSTARDTTTLQPAQRVRQADELGAFAERLLSAADLNDEALTQAATAASIWATHERAAIPLLEADATTLQALFGELHESSADILTTSIDGAKLFFTLDKDGRCRGVYAVGPTGHRELDSTTWPGSRLLAQAFGRPIRIPPRVGTDGVSSTWKEGKVEVVVRWRGGVPAELRIGDAKP